VFYHGTSDAVVPVGTRDILPPSQTGILSEAGRKKNLERVFFTRDAGYAKIYAGRSCANFGGNPVVFRVSPCGKVDTISDRRGASVLTASSALVEEVIS